MVEAIQTSSENLLTVINDILDFSQIDSGNMKLRAKTFDLHKLVQSTSESVIPALAKKSLDIVHMHQEGATLYGDESRIRQCLLNLLTNAAKFSDHNIIVIRTDIKESDEKNSTALLTISVEDR